MKRSFMLTLLVLLGVGLANPGIASAAERSDYEIFRDIAAQVDAYTPLTIFDSVSISVDRGQVTLTGRVTMPFKASGVEQRASRVDGVKGVRNTIQSLPVSQTDARLRIALARGIYSNAALQMYGLGAHPSIHIVVERGRVTLDGVVDHDMDKTIATMVARSFPVFEVTNNLKTNEEVTAALEKLR